MTVHEKTPLVARGGIVVCITHANAMPQHTMSQPLQQAWHICEVLLVKHPSNKGVSASRAITNRSSSHLQAGLLQIKAVWQVQRCRRWCGR